MPSSFCWKFRLATLWWRMWAESEEPRPLCLGQDLLGSTLLCTAPPVLAVYLTMKQSVICHLSLYLLVLLLSYVGVQRNISLSKLKYKSKRAIYFLKKNRRTPISYSEEDAACSVCKPNVALLENCRISHYYETQLFWTELWYIFETIHE